jgi:hypothetical protein
VNLTHETAEWADGPRLCAWLGEKGINPHHYGTMGRRATDWRRGSAADFYTVDRLLVAAGWHPSDLPESVWRDSPLNYRNLVAQPGKSRPGNRSGAKLTAESVSQLRRERLAGATYAVLAERYGVSVKSVALICRYRTWVDVKAAA